MRCFSSTSNLMGNPKRSQMLKGRFTRGRDGFMKKTQSPIAVLGAGSWGTALALLLARNQQIVHLWDVNKELMTQLQAERTNTRYMPDHSFSENILLYHELESCLEGTTDLLLVVPSHAFRHCLNSVKSYFTGKRLPRLAWATKGLDPSNQLLHQVVEDIFGQSISMAVIAGPSYAKEVAADLPTAVSLSSNDAAFANELIERLHNLHFRVYRNSDMIGM